MRGVLLLILIFNICCSNKHKEMHAQPTIQPEDIQEEFLQAYFGKNGTWGNSGDPTSGSTGTGAAAISANEDYWHLALGDRNSSNTATYEVNFGNGYFGSTAVSSAGTNASGFGVFEYDVPTGYTALCTKGINSF